MKTFVCVLLAATVVVAEPDWFGQNFRFARQEVEEPTTVSTADAPYPAAGYRPDIEFKLPSKQETAPIATTSGLPDSSYGPPAFEYGPPESTTTEIPGQAEPETTESLQVEGLTKEKIEEAPKPESEVINNQGTYYVLLPGSLLQRVEFQTENDLRNMAYTARLQYKDEGRAPLYIYTASPQYQASAALVQVSGALAQPSTAYQPPATYVTPSVGYTKPFATYGQPW